MGLRLITLEIWPPDSESAQYDDPWTDIDF